MGAVEDSADALDEIGGREQAVGLEDLALAMEPFGLDRVQPRALDGQRADEQAHANAGLFDRVVVRPEPAPDNLRVVPGGVVPDEQDGALALGLRLLGAPREELNRHGADRSPVDKAQPHLLTALRGLVPGSHQQAVAGHGFGIGIVARDRLLDQAQRSVVVHPGMQGGVSQPAPPDLVLEPEEPVRMGLGQPDQAVAPRFFSTLVNLP